MNTIPYFLRNPVIDDQEQQVATMAPPAPQGMSVVQHPMHAMITPIKGEPLSSMRPAEDPGQEPSAMSSSDAEGMGGGQMSSSLASKQPKVVTMSPMERYEDSINQRLMADYKKDQNPWGSANNHPGTLGKILHGLNHATGGDTRRQWEETALGGEVQKIEGEKSQQALQGAQTAHLAQETASGEPVEIGEDQANELGAPELAGTKVPPSVLAALYKQHGINATHIKTTGMNVQGREDVAADNNKTKSDIAFDKDNTAVEINGLKFKTSKEIADAHDKTQLLMRQLQDATSSSNADKRVAASGGKVPMVITNRASLASNVKENADAVEKLIASRPDIIGPAGGRYSNVAQMIGSDDPDIQALGVRIHNIALASNGAHGIRSERAIKGTEDSIFNHFHAGPNALRAALEAQKDSTSTFLQDERNFEETGRRTGAPKQGAAPQGGTKVLKFNPNTGRLE